jgi:hypothetical protein
MKQYPLNQDQARQALATNYHRILWQQPDKIVVDAVLVGGERHTATLVDLLCAAYDLKPNK